MRNLKLAIPILIPALLTGSPLSAQRCDVRQELQRELSAADLEGVLIDAGAGSLEVVGADVDRVTVRAVLCASSDDMAAQSRLVVEQRQGAAWIEADLADGRGWRNDYARMDLAVAMPRSLAADIEDGSGEIVVRSIAAVRIDDGSGSLDVEDIEGAVRIEDGSGDIRVRNVGSVEVDDGSGGLEIADVRGSVVVEEDGSGEIDIRSVAGDVRIEEDGSGSIDVVGVGGDFILEDDGSGSVRYRDVEGRVSVPPSR